MQRLNRKHFDGADAGAAFTKLQSFGVPTGTLFVKCVRAFWLLAVKVIMGSGRALTLTSETVLETVRFCTAEQFPGLFSALYTWSLPNVPAPFATVDTMC